MRKTAFSLCEKCYADINGERQGMFLQSEDISFEEPERFIEMITDIMQRVAEHSRLR